VTTVERLERGLERIRRGWCQGALSRDANGIDCCDIQETGPPMSWCMIGAVAGQVNECSILFHKAIDEIFADECLGGIDSWNDEPGRTQSEVIAVFERAIELAREEAGGEL